MAAESRRSCSLRARSRPDSPWRRGLAAVVGAGFLIPLGVALAVAVPPAATTRTFTAAESDDAPADIPPSRGWSRCSCERFADDLAAAKAMFASRGEAVDAPLDANARARYRERVDATFRRARCLIGCDAVAETARNDARALLATAAFRSHTAKLSEATVEARLREAIAVTERCLEVEPENASCHLHHATATGILLRDTWNPLNVTIPRRLRDEFRAARAGAAPGYDLFDGAATRGEVLLLMRAPGFLGGNVEEARRLAEEASAAPRFGCVLSNRLMLAEARARTGAPERAIAELRAAAAGGLPDCGPRYENALSVEQAKGCLDRLENAPTTDPGWNEDCR